jgi:pimeloyl-ACP methyl ester carboxylesterase
MAAHFAIDKSLTVNTLHFHYRDWGGRGWPVMLLHGLASTSHIWDLTAPLLIDEARVVAFDQRGHGQSDKPDGSYSFETISKDVLGALVELQMERPVIIGHSWGALVGLWIAANHPDEISGLVMLDGGLNEPGSQMTWEETLEKLSPPDLDGMPVDEFRDRVTSHSPQGLITPAVESAILANFEIDMDNLIHPRLPRTYHERILHAIWQLRLEELYDQVTCPTLILPARWPERDDAAHLAQKEAGAANALQHIVDVEVIWLEETIHDAPLQRPLLVAEHIKKFVLEQV